MKKFLCVFLLGLLLLAHFVEALPPTPPYSLPSQTGNSGKFLTTNGTVESWGIAGSTDGNDTEINRLATAIKALSTAPMNGTVGAGTPSTGAFTTLSASSTVSGTGFSTYLASPPAIGGTAAAAGTFTTLTGGTISAGAAGMTVDADGDVNAKSLSTTRTDSPDYLRVYEATSDGDLYAEWAAPATGTGFTATTRYKFPVAAPSGNQVMSFPTPTDSATQGEWITPLINTTGEAILSSTTLPLNADGNTTLYQVPAGKTAVLTKAILVAGADAGTSDLTIGRAGTLNDFLATQNLDNVNAAGDVAFFAPILHADTQADIKKSYAAGVVIKAVVANQNGGASNTLHLFGFLY